MAVGTVIASLGVALGDAAVADAAIAGLSDRYQCAACATHAQLGRAVCDSLGSCRFTDCTACQGHSESSQQPPVAAAASVQLRVAKGFGTKPYNHLRVSVITPSSEPAPFDADYSAPFKYKWTNSALHSSVVAAPSSGALSFLNTTITLPAQGAGVTGVLIADPCVAASRVGCSFGRKFKTDDRTMALLNLFAGAQSDVSYWGILGDNFYDQDGSITAAQYAKLTYPTLSKITLMVPGNHGK